jgi:hypothetical protein
MAKRKMGGSADYVIPLVVLTGVGVGIYFLWQKLFGSGSGSGLPGPLAAANTAINNAAASSPAPVQTATMVTSTSLDAWYGTQNDATNPFLPNLYNSDPGATSLSAAVAQDLWTTMYTASNATAFFKPTPDLSTIQAQWAQYVQSQLDVSYICTFCETTTGSDLWTFMGKYFDNDQTGQSGQTNVVMLNALVQWVASLPVGLPED